jgi:thioredoxin/glutathione reductase (selenoprotein)
MVEGVQNHIGSLNWGYRTSLRDNKVEYINQYARFLDPHTIEGTNKAKKTFKYTARRFVLAIGGRPNYPDIPGAKEFGITSDDLFSLTTPPGKTLVVGASYVALECAGFLAGLGYETVVMARSIFLRGFDQECAEKIAAYMSNHGTRFIRPAVPSKLEKVDGSNKIKVEYVMADGTTKTEEFDTVLFAVGRRAECEKINLENTGVIYDKKSDGKIPVARDESTNIPHIYAIGDIIKGNLELTPVAIKSGKLLAQRLYNNSHVLMDYGHVPTTVFTPLEYGSVGLSEEAATQLFGAEQIEVFHAYYKPLEWTVSEREDNVCFIKVICNISQNMKILGMHALGIHSGEVIQGWALGIKCGATKEQLDSVVGIHPTSAEEFTTLNITKRSGVSAQRNGC